MRMKVVVRDPVILSLDSYITRCVTISVLKHVANADKHSLFTAASAIIGLGLQRCFAAAWQILTSWHSVKTSKGHQACSRLRPSSQATSSTQNIWLQRLGRRLHVAHLVRALRPFFTCHDQLAQGSPGLSAYLCWIIWREMQKHALGLTCYQRLAPHEASQHHLDNAVSRR